jgi:hypothetical protein
MTRSRGSFILARTCGRGFKCPACSFKQLTNRPPGGTVHEEQDYRESQLGKERTIARFLADSGEQVWLQNPSGAAGAGTPDGFILEAGRTFPVEFKRITTAVNLAERIHANIREGSRQAPDVVIYVDQAGIDFAALGERAERAFFRYPRDTPGYSHASGRYNSLGDFK